MDAELLTLCLLHNKHNLQRLMDYFGKSIKTITEWIVSSQTTEVNARRTEFLWTHRQTLKEMFFFHSPSLSRMGRGNRQEYIRDTIGPQETEVGQDGRELRKSSGKWVGYISRTNKQTNNNKKSSFFSLFLFLFLFFLLLFIPWTSDSWRIQWELTFKRMREKWDVFESEKDLLRLACPHKQTSVGCWRL